MDERHAARPFLRRRRAAEQAPCERRPDRAPECVAILAIGASRRTVHAASAWLTKPAQAHASSAAALTSSLKRRVRRWL